jgi:hypothetical protein
MIDENVRLEEVGVELGGQVGLHQIDCPVEDVLVLALQLRLDGTPAADVINLLWAAFMDLKRYR